MKLTKEKIGYIYFVQEGDDGPVKIGYSWYNPEKRIKQLQCGNPTELHLRYVIEERLSVENRFHKSDIAKKYHVRGEWYMPEILNEMILSFLEGGAINGLAETSD